MLKGPHVQAYCYNIILIPSIPFNEIAEMKIKRFIFWFEWRDELNGFAWPASFIEEFHSSNCGGVGYGLSSRASSIQLTSLHSLINSIEKKGCLLERSERKRRMTKNDGMEIDEINWNEIHSR